MATLDEEKKKRQQAANTAYGSAIESSVPGRAVNYVKTTTPYQAGQDVRGAYATTRGAVSSVIENQAQRGQAARTALASNIEAGARAPTAIGEFYRGITGQPAYQPPTRQPAVRPAPVAPAITAAGSEDRIRAIANEGRVPDTRPAPAVIAPVRGNRAIFTERPEGGRSAFAPNIEGTDRTGFAATPQEMQRYQAGVAQQGVNTQEEAYRRALENTTLSSGDTWFDFMQKNQQRAALLAGRKSALEGEKLASAERLQDRRGAMEAALQQERLGTEQGMQRERLTAAEKAAQAQRDFDLPYRQAQIAASQAEVPYRGALQRQAGAQAELYETKVQDAQQEAALRREYGDPNTTPARRYVIAQILQGKPEKSPLPDILQTMLGTVDPKDHQKLLDAYATANSAAQNPTSRYFGNPEGAFAELLGAAQGEQQGGYAAGGVVDANAYADGGAVGLQDFGGLPEVNETATLAKLYTQYAQSTQAMGATPVDFNKFSTLMTTVRDRMAVPMQDPSAMGMPGYAEGGAVDVSGRQVFGPGTETSDSIPAIIDGQTPAALSTNEFVWTADATEAASPAVLKAVMTGLERNDPEIVSGIMALAAKAVKKPAQPAME